MELYSRLLTTILPALLRDFLTISSSLSKNKKRPHPSRKAEMGAFFYTVIQL